MFIRNGKTFKISLLLIFVVAALLICGLSLNNTESADSIKHLDSEGFAVYYMDVGQGDCEIITLPDGINIIIDGGTGSGEDRLVADIKSLGIEKFDYVIATHPHEDHIGGLDKVIDTFGANKVYMPYASASTRAFEKFAAAVKKSGAEVNEAKAGVVMIDSKDVRAEFLAPCSDSYNELNNYSAVLKLTYKDCVFLFMGDAEEESENEILSGGFDIKADVLKVGHHGSSSSTTDNFLEKAAPQIAVIEVGEDNSYGHPHSQILNKLGKTSVYRTDKDGMVKIECDGNKFNVFTEK